MKLLIVVEKLLTGFDAPPCTYLYIDGRCRIMAFSRLSAAPTVSTARQGFGYIVDYKDLFKKVENAISVYSSELDNSAGGASPDVLLQDRLKGQRAPG